MNQLAIIIVIGACRPSTPPNAISRDPNAPVRIVILTPADRQPDPVDPARVDAAFREVQRYYAQQIGRTFRYRILTASTPHPAAWYATTPHAGSEWGDWFYENVADDGFAAVGQRDAAGLVTMFYIRAREQCGQQGGAARPAGGAVSARGEGVISEKDLQGLAGERTEFCPGGDAEVYPWWRWVGGPAHELGHAFGLRHPPECDAGAASCNEHDLMRNGYLSFPDAQLTDEDRAILGASPFLTAP
jgi:hypothetical protein